MNKGVDTPLGRIKEAPGRERAALLGEPWGSLGLLGAADSGKTRVSWEASGHVSPGALRATGKLWRYRQTRKA